MTAVAVTVIAANTSVTGNVSDFNVGSVGSGATPAGIFVVCAMIKGSTARHITGFTIDGVSVGTNFNAPTTDRTSKCGIGWASVAAGAHTVHVLLNDTNGLSSSGTVQCYVLENASASVAAGAQVNVNSGSNVAANNLPTTRTADGASVYAMCVGGSISATWSAATEDTDGAVGRIDAHSTGDPSDSHTETCTVGGTGGQLQAVGVSFKPNSVAYTFDLDTAAYVYTANANVRTLDGFTLGTAAYAYTANAMTKAVNRETATGAYVYTGGAVVKAVGKVTGTAAYAYTPQVMGKRFDKFFPEVVEGDPHDPAALAKDRVEAPELARLRLVDGKLTLTRVRGAGLSIRRKV